MAHNNPTIPASKAASPAVPVPAAARVLKLVAPQPDADTVNLLKTLLREAEQGKLTGLVAVTFCRPDERGADYNLSYAGTAARHPLLAVGAIDVCQMLMRETALEDARLG